MISVVVFVEDPEEREILRARLNVLPRVGEYLWLTGEAQGRVAKELGVSSMLVRAVAHWCGSERPGTGFEDNPMHSAAIYVDPVRRAE